MREHAFAVVFGIAVAVLIYAASQTVLYWPFLRIQNKIDDTHFIIRNMLGGPAEAEKDGIVIVDIDDRTTKSIGRIKSRRWPRRHMAKVIGNLKRDGARLIFLDIIFEGITRDNVELADSVRSAGNVIAGYYFKLDEPSRKRRPLDPVLNEDFVSGFSDRADGRGNRFIRAKGVVFPFPHLRHSVRALGFTNYILDPDGILRHIPLYIVYGAYGGKGSAASASASLQMWLFLNGISHRGAVISPKGVRFGDRFIPTDRHCFMRLNFKSPEPVYPYVSFIDVLKGDYAPGTFRDKIVMIGSSSEKIGDLERVPGGGNLPGVEIHAAALSTLMNGNFLRVVSGNVVFMISVVCGAFSGLVFNRFHPAAVGLPAAVGVPSVLYAAAVYLFVRHSLLLNVSVPSFVVFFLFVTLTTHRLMEHYERKQADVSG